MIDLSYYVGDRFVFYDSNLGLYFTRYNSEDSIGWVKDWNNSCFATGYLVVTALLKLLNDNGLEECYGESVISMAYNFKSVGLDNIWTVPVDWSGGIDFSDDIDFIDSVRLEDILSNARS